MQMKEEKEAIEGGVGLVNSVTRWGGGINLNQFAQN